MSSITSELAELLSTVQRPGDFYPTGSTERPSKNQVFDLYGSKSDLQPIFGRPSRLEAGATENFS